MVFKKGSQIGKEFRFKKGFTPWNKNLIAKTDERVRKNCENFHGEKGSKKPKHWIENISKLRKEQWKDKTSNYHSKERSKKIKKARAKQILPVKDSSIEVKIQNFLKQLGIEFFTHQYIKIEHGYQCDILIPSMNLVIECDGDYWHKYPIGRDIDNIRTKELLAKGFKVLRLWEKDIKLMEVNDLNIKLKEVKTW